MLDSRPLSRLPVSRPGGRALQQPIPAHPWPSSYQAVPSPRSASRSAALATSLTHHRAYSELAAGSSSHTGSDPERRTSIAAGTKRTAIDLEPDDPDELARLRKKAHNQGRATFSDYKHDAIFFATLHRIHDRAQCHFSTRDPFPPNASKRKQQRERKVNIH